MKRRSLVLILGTLLFVVRAAAAEPYRLGATVPLTGDFASYGRLIRDGIELAKDDLLQSGFEVETYYEDTPLPGAQALNAAQSLVSRVKIDALAGNFFNPVIPLIAPLLAAHRIPAFHTAAPDDHILGAGQYVFSTNAAIRDEARALADYACTVLGARSAAMLYIATNFGESYARHFAARFAEHGGSILYTESTMLGDFDLRLPLLKAKAKTPDVILTAYFGAIQGAVMRSVRELKIEQTILAPYETEDPSVLETAGAIRDRQLRFFVGEGEPDNAVRARFEKRFQERYHYSPRILAANAYDAAMLAVAALAECRKDRECAMRNLHKVKDYRGAAGTLSMDADGAARKAFFLKTVEGGQFVRAEDANFR